MKVFFTFIITLCLGSALLATEGDNTWTLSKLVELASGKNLEVQELRKSVVSASSRTNSRYSSLLPELGLEGGWRGNTEKEKKYDTSYYGYARYNIFRGYRDLFSIQIASKEEEFLKFKENRMLAKIGRQIASVYYDVIFTRSLQDLREEDYQITEEQIKIAKRKAAGGLTTNADLYEFELHQNQIKGEISQLEQEAREKERSLKRLVGFDENENLTLKGQIPETQTNLESEEELLKKAFASNETFRESQRDYHISEYEAKSSAGAWLPSINVEAQYGKLAETDFRSSHRDSWLVGAVVTFPIFTGFGGIADARSKSANIERSSISLERTRLDLQNEIRSLREKIVSLKERLKLERQRKEQSKKYYQVTLSEYKRGVKNSPDLEGATDKMFESRAKELEILKDLQQSSLRLQELTGEARF